MYAMEDAIPGAEGIDIHAASSCQVDDHHIYRTFENVCNFVIISNLAPQRSIC